MNARRPLAPCGTPSAYRRHLRHREPTCQPCRAAHVAAVTAHRRRPPAPPRELLPCGTEAAYRRHLRWRELACRPCMDAHAAEVRSRTRQVAA